MTRRDFLRRATVVGVTGALLEARPRRAGAQPSLETTRLRLPRTPSICVAPQYLAEDLLRSEGFTSIEWVDGGPTGSRNVGVAGAKRLAAGEVDVQMNFAAPLVIALDEGIPIVVIA